MKKRKLKKLIRRIRQEKLKRKDRWIGPLSDALDKYGAYIP